MTKHEALSHPAAPAAARRRNDLTTVPRRALITGTTSGIGRAILEQLLEEGFEIIGVNRREMPDAEAFGRARFHRLDITDYDAVLGLLRQLEAGGDLPEAFFLNAGINMTDNAARFSFPTYQNVMDVNLRGTMTFLGAAAELGLKGRTFVGLSSTSNIVANPGNVGYYLSKRAVKQAFDVLRKADPANVYKVVVLGPVHTNIMRNSLPLEGMKKKIFDSLAVGADTAAQKITRFTFLPGNTLYYTTRSVLFYGLIRALLSIFPRLYMGSHAGNA